MSLSSSKQLYDALISLRSLSEGPEADLQAYYERAAAHRGVKSGKSRGNLGEEEDEDQEEESSDDAEDETSDDTGDIFSDEEGEPSEDEEKGKSTDKDEKKGAGKDGKLAGAKELVDTPQKLPDTLTSTEFIENLNQIRAGSSLKDDETRERVISYIMRLDDGERKDLWIHLNSLARIILGGEDSARVLTPASTTGPDAKGDKERKKEPQSQKKNDPSKSSGPIVAVKSTVSEGVKKRMTEIPFILRSSKTVPFGHASHVKDLESLFSHLKRFLSCQEPGSESYLSISLAAKTVRRQLNAAKKKSMGKEVTIDAAVAVPLSSLVEED